MNEAYKTKKDMRAERLTYLGFKAIEEQRFDEAIDIGNRLRRIRQISAFEIQALAYYGKGKSKRAINTLKEGLKKAPDESALWQLLGNYLSDKEEYDKAYKAYDSALECPEADRASLHLNYSVALGGQKKYREALLHLEFVDLGKYDIVAFSAAAHKSYIYNGIGLFSQANELADRFIDIYENDPARFDEIYGYEVALSELCAEKGYAMWKMDESEEDIIGLLRASVLFWKANERAQWLIRMIHGEPSGNAKLYKVFVEGEWAWPSEEGEPLNFITNYLLIADSTVEALEFIKFFEPDELAGKMHIVEKDTEIFGVVEDEPKGIYGTDQYVLYPRSDAQSYPD
jgi:tetratricopeptide (TPR) repeat protein